MQSVRKCTNPECGWEFPLSYNLGKCRFCKSFIDIHQCSDCGEWKYLNNFYIKNNGYKDNICKLCRSVRGNAFKQENPEWDLQYNRRYHADRRAAANKIYEDWKASTQLPFKPMTEEQWLEACAFFNGCALCGNPHIEARQFFIHFEDGGRYAPWNMYPVCGTCADHKRVTDNPFSWIDKQHFIKPERKERLIEYFIMQIEKVRDGSV